MVASGYLRDTCDSTKTATSRIASCFNSAMNRDEQDDLWVLLGKAKTPQVSPFFSRNVLRALREQEQERPGLTGWLRQRWRLGAVGACGLFLVSAGLFFNAPQNPDQISILAQQVSLSPDYDVITHLDELIETEENAVWLDNVY